jgi:hypothetical protein
MDLGSVSTERPGIARAAVSVFSKVVTGASLTSEED